MSKRAMPSLGTFVIVALAALYVLFIGPYVTERVRLEAISPEWLWCAPIVLVVVLFWLVQDLVRQRNKEGFYLSRALVRLAFAAALVALLMPTVFSEYRTRTTQSLEGADALVKLARHRDARVRALVMEVCATRGNKARPIVEKGLKDRDPLVQKAAALALQKIDASKTR